MKLRNVNNIKYREQKYVLSNLDQYQSFKSPTILSPSSMFYKPIVISKYSTASNSIVYKIKNRLSQRYIVLKISPLIHSSLHEIEIYKIINNLVEFNITPFVLKSYKLSNRVINKDVVHKSLKNDFKFNKGVITCTETYYKNISLLNKSKLKNPLVCFFQTLYTLECFNRIGLSHNDLHHSNIFVVKLKGIKNYYNKFMYISRTGVKREFYLPTQGEQIRIFDFDRSLANQIKNVKSKFKLNSKSSKEQLYILESYFSKLYTYFDDKRDLQRFLFPFLAKGQQKSYEIALRLFNLNNNKTMVDDYPNSFLQKCSERYMQYDYYVDKNTHVPFKIPDKYLPSVDQMIMSYVFDDLTILPINGKVYTTYKIMS